MQMRTRETKKEERVVLIILLSSTPRAPRSAYVRVKLRCHFRRPVKVDSLLRRWRITNVVRVAITASERNRERLCAIRQLRCLVNFDLIMRITPANRWRVAHSQVRLRSFIPRRVSFIVEFTDPACKSRARIVALFMRVVRTISPRVYRARYFDRLSDLASRPVRTRSGASVKPPQMVTRRPYEYIHTARLDGPRTGYGPSSSTRASERLKRQPAIGRNHHQRW